MVKKKAMSTRSGAHYLAICACLVITLAGAAFYARHNYAVLEVKEHDTGQILYSRLLKVGEGFDLVHVHSVTRQPVLETFCVQDNRTLALQEMRYDSFGANLPVGPEKTSFETTQFIVGDGYYKIKYRNRHFSRIPLRVGQVVADHRLVFEDGSILRFLDIAGGGAFVEISVRPVF